MLPSDSENMVKLAAYWTRTQPLIAGFVSSLIPNFHDAEDVLQHVAMVLARKFDEFDHERSFSHWAMGIARYEVLVYYRKQRREKQIFDTELISQIGQTYGEMRPRLKPIHEALQKCMHKVKQRDRQILQLWYVEQLKPEEIAKLMGVARSTLYVILHRVRQGLKLCIRHQLAIRRETE